MFCDRNVEKSQKLSHLARQLGPIFVCLLAAGASARAAGGRDGAVVQVGGGAGLQE